MRLARNNGGQCTRSRDLGGAIFESSLCLFVITIFTYFAIEGLRLAWLASAAQIIASTTAQIGSVARPADSNGTAPTETQLRIGSQPYLSTWRQYNWNIQNGQSGAAPALDFLPSSPNLRAINLGLGLATQYLEGFQTVQVYTSTTNWANLPLPNKQFYIVPLHYGPDNMQTPAAPQGPTHYMVCIGIKVFFGLRKVCRDSRGARSWQ